VRVFGSHAKRRQTSLSAVRLRFGTLRSAQT